MRGWIDRFLGIPWVYDTIRPLAVGGIDLADLAEFCGVGPGDRVLDLGCGTAQLLRHIRCEAYLGVDLDATALRRAARLSPPGARFILGDDWDEACRELNPGIVLMIGFVHHVPDEVFSRTISRIRKAGVPETGRIVTLDVTYLPGKPVNNILSRLDRGRHVRPPEGYERLFENCRMQIRRRETLATSLGYVHYVGFHLSLGGVS